MPLDAAQLAQLIESQGAVLRLWLGSRGDAAEDLVQDAFCRLAAEDPPPRNPVAWLYTVCRNLAETRRLSEQRRRVRERSRPCEEVFEVDPARRLEQQEALEAVQRLEPGLREVLIARVWGQLSLSEIAEGCGISTATACRRYEAALQALRLILENNSRSSK